MSGEAGRERAGQGDMVRPKIGFLPIGRLSSPEFGRDLDLGRELIGRLDADVIQCPRVWSEPDLLDQLELLRIESVDLLVLYVLHGMSAEQQVLAGARSGVPVALWALPTNYSFSSCTSAVGALRERGCPVKMTLAPAGDDRVLRDLTVWARAAFARAALQRSRIGTLGGIFPNLPAAQYHRDVLFEKLGPQIVHLPLAWLQHALRDLGDQVVHEAIADLRARFDVQVNDRLLGEAIRFDMALQRLAEEHRLSAFAIECHTETNLLFGINPCISYASRQSSFVIGCEGDAVMAIAMLMVRHLTGAESCLSDVFSLEGDILTLRHCGASCQMGGAGPVRIAGLKAPAAVGVDLTLAMCMPRVEVGRVTLLRLHGRAADHLHLAMGEVVGSEINDGTTIQVRLDAPQAFLGEVCGNHYLVAHGDLRPLVGVLAEWVEMIVTET